jgi:hypothetical protein
MTCRDLLQALQRQGIDVTIDGPDLVIDGPADRIDDNLTSTLRAHKPELLQTLRVERYEMMGWCAADAELLAWFETAPLPTKPFLLFTWLRVLEPLLFYATLQGDILAGPRGPRARSRALQDELARLRQLFGSEG